jgi:hypothetical protein
MVVGLIGRAIQSWRTTMSVCGEGEVLSFFFFAAREGQQRRRV